MSLLQNALRRGQAMVGRWPMLAACIAVCCGLVVAYTAVFMLTMGGNPLDRVGTALINSIPPAIYAYGVMIVIRSRIIGAHPLLQAGFHIVAAPVFGVTWYVTVIVFLGLSQGSLADGFAVSPFRGPAFHWQNFQGMTLYIGAAAAAYAFHYRAAWKELAAATAEAQASSQAVTAASDTSDTLILRQGDELRPVDIEDIILVSGAGDYAEVTTARGTHLSRKTLSEFETLLPPARFVRVHRSRIVNIEAVQAAEPEGGGRLTLQLRGGESVSTSRAGARLIKERSI
ncbi:LytTR family DNA-binding domain-containing protein [Maricaulis sp.]|uniref:LytTR family DNA-binding domain-containing protein n=1 Tax=Maricaulis sp. TaxID=1486257 RepID=UPI0026326C2A|nr:LytTR family DNA-binding domain-containing protein [Maricaulis sp.]